MRSSALILLLLAVSAASAMELCSQSFCSCPEAGKRVECRCDNAAKQVKAIGSFFFFNYLKLACTYANIVPMT